MAEVLDGYIRVSRIGGREGEAYRSPKIQKAEIENLARIRGSYGRTDHHGRGRVRRQGHCQPWPRGTDQAR